MINKTLDLPFDEPQETYSTSEHLFHDQGIPPGTKGRIVDPAPVEPRERSERRPRDGERQRTRDRNRTRTRGGEKVGDGSPKAASGDQAPKATASGQGRGRALGQPQPPPASSFRLHERTPQA